MDFKAATEKLGDKSSVKLGNNTYLERRDAETIAVRLHNTDILTFTARWTEYDSGGWQTPTTWARMRDFGPMQIHSNGKRGMSLHAMEMQAPYSCDYDCYSANDFKSSWEHVSGSLYRCTFCGKVKEGRKRTDWDVEFCYFDGIRVKPDGSGLAKEQPHKPEVWEPVVTRSGWTGMTRGESNRRNSVRYSSGFTALVETAAQERAVRADDSLSLEEKRAELAVPAEPQTMRVYSCPFLIFVPEHYNALGYCKCHEPEEQTRMVTELDYTRSDFESHGIRFRGTEPDETS